MAPARPQRARLSILLLLPLGSAASVTEGQSRQLTGQLPEDSHQRQKQLVTGRCISVKLLERLKPLRRACGRAASPVNRALGAVRNQLVSEEGIGPAKLAATGGAVAFGFLLPELFAQVSGFIRGFRFWAFALPVYVEYRVAERRWDPARSDLSLAERKLRWQRLHEKHAPRILAMTLKLRGFYVKIGQVCSTRQDMFPAPWTEELSQLQGEHPELLARPVAEILKIVRRDLGSRARAFAEVEEEPLGAAATGQVHRARLTDGREVVLKVQYPEAARLYRQDFASTKLFCALLQPEHLGYLQELETQFGTEFDYRREARSLAEISSRFDAGSGNPYASRVRIPKPVLSLSSKNVVVMEYLEGETLLSYARRRKRELDNCSFLWRLFLGWRLAHELRNMLKLLIDVQGYQIFIDGMFNGDPHPGNVLRLADGQLGLIDYGNVKRLSVHQRALLGELILALAEGSRSRIARAAAGVGFKTKYGTEEGLVRFARLWFDRDDGPSRVLPNGQKAVNIQVYLERLNAFDPIIQTPEVFLMAARNSFLLRGMGSHLGVQLHMATKWQHLAQQAIDRAYPPSTAGATATAFMSPGRR